jgi:hypothetical protein
MKKPTLFPEILQRLLFAALAVAALQMPEAAFAQGGGIGQTATAIVNNQLDPTTQLLSAILYIGGGVLVAAGALKLKQHSENPTQTPMSHGLGRVGAGAALMAIPYFSNVAVNTLELGNAATPFARFAAL